MKKLLIPSFPAFVLLLGPLFPQVAFYIIGVDWSRSATLIFYLILTFWVFVSVWVYRSKFQFFNRIDAIFLAFVFIIFSSLCVASMSIDFNWRLLFFLFLMVIVPFFCGRCIISSSELLMLRALILAAGLTIMPIALVDRLMTSATERGRFAFFGMDHSPLLIGALIAWALISLHTMVICRMGCGGKKGRAFNIASFILLCLTAAYLVWVSARGWLIAGLAGGIVVTVLARRAGVLVRCLTMAVILLFVILSLKSLSRIDSAFGVVYTQGRESVMDSHLYLSKSGVLPGEATSVNSLVKVHTARQFEATCKAIIEGDDSVKIRLMLYQEAAAMFWQNPWFGIGAGKFGLYSCTGLGGFPHSTFLHVMSELGMTGGSIFVVLIFLVFTTIVNRALNARDNSEASVMIFLASIFVCVLIADQIYGNYFTAVPISLVSGIAAGMRGSRNCAERVDV